MSRACLRSLLLLALSFSNSVAQSTESNGLVTGSLGNATVVKNNPSGAAFRAVFPKKQFTPTPSGNIKGVVVAETNSGGTGVSYNIKMTNLPTEGGPFVYHVHQYDVPKDGNCTDTGAHLDPFERGETPACDPDLPQTCQVGDLAGKHGAIVTTSDSTTFQTSYTDDFTATGKGQSFIGNLSVVLHFANLTRITCANFKAIDMESGGGMMKTLNDLLNPDDDTDADSTE
ncbi:Cell surface superoxide dismutase [Cu-Zn] 4 [Gnomoniopsis smithogilvyi]|uniref:superoxide dismutase n=1 Tax=Gnomoniopsis smithogilvyi TaxID=1191159 RepID=A0A9W9CZB4_9PEZI|nr:Cell surface superoxide dismutase [Cu-Zn] 4 [Gnomoniopsis smithogilvyi]